MEARTIISGMTGLTIEGKTPQQWVQGKTDQQLIDEQRQIGEFLLSKMDLFSCSSSEAVNCGIVPFIPMGVVGLAVDEVIAETLAAKGNITSQLTLTADEALAAGKKFLGPGYKEIGKPGSGVFQSADGLRQFRIDSNSLSGVHGPSVPHVHFEMYAPGAKFPTVNNHVPFID